MAYTHTIVASFPSHAEAERVVLELQKEGFDMQKLSIIGKDYQTTESESVLRPAAYIFLGHAPVSKIVFP